MALANGRRLEPTDVRAIFESLHEGKPPPPDLEFSIVPVGPSGLRLSPPAHAFPDGLYVLLRAKNKNKQQHRDPPKAPEHLKHLVMKELPPLTCPWSLSGPQFPKPTAIQQRYCYPKGKRGRKGGALWTIFRADGKEDNTYRLLHVYYSKKRAANRGAGSPSGKRSKRSDKKKKTPPRTPLRRTPRRLLVQSPPITTPRSITSPPFSHSPLGYDIFSSSLSPVPIFPAATSPAAMEQHQQHLNYPKFTSPPTFHPLATPSPFRTPNTDTGRNIIQSPPRPASLKRDREEEQSMATDPFHCDLETASLHGESDSVWNDPFMNLMLKPSVDTDSPATTTPSEYVFNLSNRLESLHESVIRDLVLAAPVSEQSALVNVMASWARRVALDPMSITTTNSRSCPTYESRDGMDDATRRGGTGDEKREGHTVEVRVDRDGIHGTTAI